MGGPYRNAKLRLMNEDPHCHWCGILVVDYGMIPYGKRSPDDMATIDHVKSRVFRRKGETVEKVLACNVCNVRRGVEDNHAMQEARGLIKKKLSTA